MIRLTKHDVEVNLRLVNEIIPQTPGTFPREIKGDYNQTYGGWIFYYFNEKGRGHAISHYRIPTKEAYHFLEGIIFTINNFKVA